MDFGLWLSWFGLALFPLCRDRNLRLHSRIDDRCSSWLFQRLIYRYFLYFDGSFGCRSWFGGLACKVNGDDLLARRPSAGRAVL